MQREYLKLFSVVLFPLVVVSVMWIIKLIEYFLGMDFSTFGLMPRTLSGLIGIITSPFIHADFDHLIANTVPMFVTLSILFYFYKEVAYPVFFYVWLFTELWVWSFARNDSMHIGASGLVYGFVSFLLFSGIIRRNVRLMAISLLIVFLYGGFFWGIFPDFFPKRNISWESHLLGALAGLILAFFYRKKGLQKETYSWETEDDENDDDHYNTDYLFYDEQLDRNKKN